MALSGVIDTNAYEGRYYTLTWTATQSIPNNSSTISWQVSCGGGTTGWVRERTLIVTLAGQTLVSKTEAVERYPGAIASGSFVLGHNAEGKSSIGGDIKVACYTASINLTGVGQWDLDTIPRQANITGAPDFTDEDNPVMYYSNPAGTAVTSLQACISLDGVSTATDFNYRDIPKDGTYYTFEMNELERNYLRNNCTTSNSRTVYYLLKSVIGVNTYISKVQKTVNIINANPIMATAAVDNKTAATNLTGSSSRIIKGYNSVGVSMTPSGLKGASIVSSQIRNGNNVISGTSGTFTNTENGSFIFSCTDSRGNSSTVTVNLTVVNYIKLTSAISSTAMSAGGSVVISAAGDYFNNTFGSVHNTLTARYRYKTNSGSYGSWSTLTQQLSGNSYNAYVSLSNLNYQNTYTFQIYVTDKINTVYTDELTITGSPIFDWGKNDFNFNVPVTVNGDLTVNGAVTINNIADMVYPVGSIYMSVNSTNPSTLFGGTWVRWGNGRVPVGIDTSDSNFNYSERTGGSNSESYTPSGSINGHALTGNELPSHTHSMGRSNQGGGRTDWGLTAAGAHGGNVVLTTAGGGSSETSSYGAGVAHTHGWSGTKATISHLQKYITCYMWKRTA